MRVTESRDRRTGHHHTDGIVAVLVNGVAVVQGGKHTQARPGQVVRRRR
jgi:hypothetical protein